MITQTCIAAFVFLGAPAATSSSPRGDAISPPAHRASCLDNAAAVPDLYVHLTRHNVAASQNAFDPHFFLANRVCAPTCEVSVCRGPVEPGPDGAVAVLECCTAAAAYRLAPRPRRLLPGSGAGGNHPVRPLPLPYTYYLQTILGYSPVKSGLAFLPIRRPDTGLDLVDGGAAAQGGPRVLMVAGMLLGGGVLILTQISLSTS